MMLFFGAFGVFFLMLVLNWCFFVFLGLFWEYEPKPVNECIRNQVTFFNNTLMQILSILFLTTYYREVSIFWNANVSF